MINVSSGAVRDYFERQNNHSRSTENRLTVFSDGVASKWSPNLANNEIWLDATALYRPGSGQVGPTFQYQGAGTCAVYGIQGDRGLAQNIKSTDYLPFVAALAPYWVQIGVEGETPAPLGPGEVAYPSGLVFDMFKLVFTGAGALSILAI